MVFELFRDLLKMAFKMLNGRSLIWQRSQFLTVTPRSPKMMEHGNSDSIWIVVMLTSRRSCPMPHPLPGPCANCGQSGLVPLHLDKVKSVSQPPPLQENRWKSLRSEPGGWRLMLARNLCPQGSHVDRRTFG